MKIGVIGDLHFSSIAPERRLDKDYLSTCGVKLSYCLELLGDCSVVIQAGDFFDRYSVSNKAIAMAIKSISIGSKLGFRIYGIAGQHDLSGHNISSYENSPLKVLEAADVFELLRSSPCSPIGYDSGFKPINFYGASFGESIPEVKDKDRYNVLVIHAMIGDRQLFPGQELENPRAFLKNYPDYNTVVCFTGETKISLLSGEEVPIKDLVGKQSFYVYSYNHHSNSIVPGLAHSCKKTKENIPILKIKLDNGEFIRCDYFERFLLRNGKYVSACNLRTGDSLMPLYRRKDNKLYEEVFHPSGKWQKTHRMTYNYKYGGIVKTRPIAHHIDYNKRNNCPNNIIAMEKYAHIKFHSEKMKARMKNSEFKKSIFTEERNRKISKASSERNKKKVNDGTHLFVTNNPNIQRKADGSLHRLAVQLSKDEKINEIRRNSQINLAQKGIHNSQTRVKSGDHNFIRNHPMKDSSIVIKREETKVKHQISYLNGIGLDVNEENWNKNKFYGSLMNYEKAKKYLGYLFPNNHKVVSIEFDGFDDVYSFVVDRFHNFALSAGVFAHNCGDYHYRFIDRVDNRLIVNAGCVIRKTIADKDHKPAVLIVDTVTQEVEIKEIPIVPASDIFDFTKHEVKSNPEIDILIEKIKNSKTENIGWKNILIQVLNSQNSPSNIKEMVGSFLEKSE